VAGLSSYYHGSEEDRPDLVRRARGHEHAETSPTGNVHGMPLAACWASARSSSRASASASRWSIRSNAVLVGIRDVDPGERELAQRCGITVFSMRELDILGMDGVMTEAIPIVTQGTAGFHMSFDMDGLDPEEAPGVGTPVTGGVTQREAHLMLEHAAESGKLLGLEFTEINPILDERNRTAEMAVALVLSGLGKRIV
jgi:arginase